jgi:medium-chain acyl-[acyl-carrier-protein] hydrolase
MRNTSRWAVQLNPDTDARLHLFCFPSAGSGANSFKHWNARLPKWLKAFGIQYPGRETRWNEPAIKNAKTLAAQIAGSILPLLEDRPFAFFGHSFGALLAFEVSHILKSNQMPTPKRLFVSARRAPHIHAETPELSTLNDHALIEKLRQFNGTPAAVLESEEMMALMAPIIRADFEADETYRPDWTSLLDVDMSIYGGKRDSHVPYKKLSAWAKHTTGASTIHTFSGDHFYLNDLGSSMFGIMEQELLQYL